MTTEVNDTIERLVISGTGPYTFSFRIFDESELAVYVDTGGLDPVSLVLNTHYTVPAASVNSEDGGTITLDATVAATYAGDTIDIRSNTIIYQPTSIRNQGAFLPVIHEDAFDRLSRQVQDQERRLNQKWGYPDNVDAVAGMTLRSTWADRYAYVNSSGEIEPAAAISLTTLTQSIIGDLLQPQTENEAFYGFVPVNTAYPEGHVRRAGILFDGSDESAELQALANFCASSGVPIRGDADTLIIGSTVTLNCTGDLSMMEISVDSSAVSPAIRVGTTTSTPTQLNGRLMLPRLTNSDKPVTGWASQQTGIELAGLYESEIYVPYVYGFDIGLDCGGYTTGFSYNNIRLGVLVANKRGLRLQGKAVGGWANQNQFIGGRIWIPSSEGAAISGARYILLAPLDVSVTGGATWPNGNTFIGTAVESGEPEYHVEIAGSNNVFLNVRWEGVPPRVKLTGHASGTDTYENTIYGGVNVAQIVFTRTGVCVYNAIINARTASMGGSGAVLNMRNDGSSAHPLIQGFDAGVDFLNKSNSDTDWSFRAAATGIQGKQTGDVNPRIDIDFLNGISQCVRARLTGSAISSAAGVVSLGNTTQTTVGAAGAASALPANPTGYLRFFIGSTEYVLPYYARA